ncbi:unnamed protein product, partial [marine sediment metagenome]
MREEQGSKEQVRAPLVQDAPHHRTMKICPGQKDRSDA